MGEQQRKRIIIEETNRIKKSRLGSDGELVMIFNDRLKNIGIITTAMTVTATGDSDDDDDER